jgi:hypothetical protein
MAYSVTSEDYSPITNNYRFFYRRTSFLSTVLMASFFGSKKLLGEVSDDKLCTTANTALL